MPEASQVEVDADAVRVGAVIDGSQDRITIGLLDHHGEQFADLRAGDIGGNRAIFAANAVGGVGLGIEGFVLGGAAGLLLARWGVKALVASVPENLLLLKLSNIDATVLGFSCCATLLTGVAAGLILRRVCAAGGVPDRSAVELLRARL